jgi:hypothetical protein
MHDNDDDVLNIDNIRIDRNVDHNTVIDAGRPAGALKHATIRHADGKKIPLLHCDCSQLTAEIQVDPEDDKVIIDAFASLALLYGGGGIYLSMRPEDIDRMITALNVAKEQVEKSLEKKNEQR